MNEEWEKFKKELEKEIPSVKDIVIPLIEKAYQIGYKYGKKDK